jgi:hypothetical protein
MRRFVSAGILALVVALFAGCNDQESQTPTEPQFKPGKVTYECPDNILEQKASLEGTIVEQLLNEKSQKGALNNVDNMARNVCKDDLPAAQYTYYEFEIEINKQNVDKILKGETGRQLILVKARAFVHLSEDGGFTIPPEALEEDGGVGLILPDSGGTVYTNNFEAALQADPDQFPGTEPVVVVLTRLPDPDPEVGSEGVIPGYRAFPQAYDIEVSRQPVIGDGEPGVLVAVCIVTDNLPEGVLDRLVLGHDNDGTGEVWTPPIKNGELSGLLPGLNCADAAYDPPESILAAGTPTWLRLAGWFLEPVVRQLLDVQPLNAMYFAGTGLGGRGNSVSPFAPVLVEMEVAPAQATIEFSQSLQLDARIPGYDLQNSDFTWSVPEFERYVAVLDDGIVTGRLSPTSAPVEVTATYGDFSATSQISVVDLVCPVDLPDPLLTFDRVETDGDLDRYWFSVSNYAAYPDALFWMTNYYLPCGANDTPSRSWVDFFEDTGGDIDQRIYGFCALESASGMQSIWFTVDAGAAPPPAVYIAIEDRACEQRYVSNTISLISAQ